VAPSSCSCFPRLCKAGTLRRWTSALLFGSASFYFCSSSCERRFAANPDQFLNRPSSPTLIQLGKSITKAEAKPAANAEQVFTCPMHPEVRQQGPGICPECGMALEPEQPAAARERVEYTCPMHPEIIRSEPGFCPICGMALEPRSVTIEEANPELADMTWRFWISLALTIPLFLLAMGRMLVPHAWFAGRGLSWAELALATPVVLWGGWPFFVRGWASILNRRPNMFTLIAIGTGAAFLHSAVATLFPDIFPEALRSHGGEVPLYFEAAAVIVTLVLLGQVLELRARNRTGAAIRALLDLAPRTHAESTVRVGKMTFHWTKSNSETAFVFARAKRSPSTVSCSKAPAMSMNR